MLCIHIMRNVLCMVQGLSVSFFLYDLTTLKLMDQARIFRASEIYPWNIGDFGVNGSPPLIGNLTGQRMKVRIDDLDCRTSRLIKM